MTFGSFGSCQLQLTACWQMIVEKMIKYLNNILKLKFENRVLEDKADDGELDERFDWADEHGWEVGLEDEFDEHESVRFIGEGQKLNEDCDESGPEDSLDDLSEDEFKHADSNK